MWSNNSETLKNSSPHPLLPTPEGPFVEIHTSLLLGYKGSEKFYKAPVETLPVTHDGKPVLSFNQLEMRPRIEQLNPTTKNDSLLPATQMATPPAWEMRPLVEILDGRPAPVIAMLPASARMSLVHLANKLAS